MVGLALHQNKDLSEKKYKKVTLEEDLLILEKLNDIENLIDTTNNIFDYVVDPELIDGCIYELNALQKKHTYYIKLCKERGIINAGLEKKEMRASY